MTRIIVGKVWLNHNSFPVYLYRLPSAYKITHMHMNKLWKAFHTCSQTLSSQFLSFILHCAQSGQLNTLLWLCYVYPNPMPLFMDSLFPFTCLDPSVKVLIILQNSIEIKFSLIPPFPAKKNCSSPSTFHHVEHSFFHCSLSYRVF